MLLLLYVALFSKSLYAQKTNIYEFVANAENSNLKLLT